MRQISLVPKTRAPCATPPYTTPVIRRWRMMDIARANASLSGLILRDHWLYNADFIVGMPYTITISEGSLFLQALRPEDESPNRLISLLTLRNKAVGYERSCTDTFSAINKLTKTKGCLLNEMHYSSCFIQVCSTP